MALNWNLLFGLKQEMLATNRVGLFRECCLEIVVDPNFMNPST